MNLERLARSIENIEGGRAFPCESWLDEEPLHGYEFSTRKIFIRAPKTAVEPHTEMVTLELDPVRVERMDRARKNNQLRAWRAAIANQAACRNHDKDKCLICLEDKKKRAETVKRNKEEAEARRAYRRAAELEINPVMQFAEDECVAEKTVALELMRRMITEVSHVGRVNGRWQIPLVRSSDMLDCNRAIFWLSFALAEVNPNAYGSKTEALLQWAAEKRIRELQEQGQGQGPNIT